MGLAMFKVHRDSMPHRVPALTPEIEVEQLRDQLALASREIAARDTRIAELEAMLTEPEPKHTERRPRR